MDEQLQRAIEKEVECASIKELSLARERLTESYREKRGESSSHMSRSADHLSYLATRMPATYAVLEWIFRLELSDVRSLLDMGAGPGTAMWAAAPHLPLLEQITLFERDGELAKLGWRLAAWSECKAIREANWVVTDITESQEIPTHDLILFSYSAGELTPSSLAPLVKCCWSAAKRYLLLVEPGTPSGFALIREVRRQLIELGAHMVAPCPHTDSCPMQQGNWCHFARRVERSALHRRVKGVSLGYEDEKFSYVLFAKEALQLPYGRVLRHPIKRPGHLHLELCTREGLEQQTVSRRSGERYKVCKKLEWGDPLQSQ